VPVDQRAPQSNGDRLDDVAVFSSSGAPKLPGRIGKPYYALAAMHAALGGIAELGGLYLLPAAGTAVLPEKFRMKRYKFWMRGVLLLWCIVLLLE
jgi:hypothetical protein